MIFNASCMLKASPARCPEHHWKSPSIGGDAESAAIGAAGRRQVGAVEEVEHFDAELGANAFRDLGVLTTEKSTEA